MVASLSPKMFECRCLMMRIERLWIVNKGLGPGVIPSLHNQSGAMTSCEGMIVSVEED